jgi:hypothetical protein
MTFTAHEFHELIKRQALPALKDKPKPVRILECFVCDGTGYINRGPVTERCSYCFGRGRVTTEGEAP